MNDTPEQPAGFPARRAALRLVDAVLRRGETLDNAAHGACQGLPAPDKALARVWQSERFSWHLTKLMHRFPEDGPFERAMQVAELAYIAGSRAAQTSIAENYVGLPV